MHSTGPAHALTLPHYVPLILLSRAFARLRELEQGRNRHPHFAYALILAQEPPVPHRYLDFVRHVTFSQKQSARLCKVRCHAVVDFLRSEALFRERDTAVCRRQHEGVSDGHVGGLDDLNFHESDRGGFARFDSAWGVFAHGIEYIDGLPCYFGHSTHT